MWNRVQFEKDLPLIRTHSGVIYKDQLYVFGGWNNNIFYNHLICYTPATQHWRYINSRNEAPQERSNHTAVVLDDNMVIFGGFNGLRMNNETILYSFAENKWISPRKLTYLPEERDSHASCVYNNSIYVFGGRGWDFYARKTLFFNDLHKLVLTNEGIKWKQIKYTGMRPSPRLLHSAVVVDDKMFIFGGRYESTRLNDLLMCDLTTNVFREIYCLESPSARTCRTLHKYNNTLVLFAGFDVEGYTSDVWTFDLIRFKWKRIKQENGAKPQARCAHLTLPDEKNQHLILFGGESTDSASLNDMWLYQFAPFAPNPRGFRHAMWKQVKFVDVDFVF